LPSECIDNETELLLRIARGDAQAFRVVFSAWSPQVYTLCVKVTKDAEVAKDLTQDIFVRLWTKRAYLPGVRNFKGFLTTMALNLLRNHLQKKVVSLATEADLSGYVRDRTPTADKAMECHELEQILQEAVAHLPPQLNRSFVLSRVQGLSHAEIAREMQLSPLTVKSHIARSLAFIRGYLEQHQDNSLAMTALVLLVASL
jgi:RNA polymerase sigma-70 factor (ECF subfamily)